MLRCNTNKVIDKAMDFIRNDLIYYIVYDVEFKNDIEILQAMQESYKYSNSEWKNKNIICYENKFKEFIYNYLTFRLYRNFYLFTKLVRSKRKRH